jgi:hypothetical protein
MPGCGRRAATFDSHIRKHRAGRVRGVQQIRAIGNDPALRDETFVAFLLATSRVAVRSRKRIRWQ